jgi:general stress protein YciG
MSGTRDGGLKTAKTNKDKFGDDFYRNIGKIGGQSKVPKGFAVNKELAVESGKKGGTISKRVKK